MAARFHPENLNHGDICRVKSVYSDSSTTQIHVHNCKFIGLELIERRLCCVFRQPVDETEVPVTFAIGVPDILSVEVSGAQNPIE